MNNIFKSLIKNNQINDPPTLVNDDGQTVLHYLCDINNEECIMNVLSRLQDKLKEREMQDFINTQDKNGNTAMHIAINNDNNIIARLLDLYGTNKHISNNKNEIISSATTTEESVIKCGEKEKMKNLFNKLTKASSDSEYSIENLDDIVTSSEDKGNIITNFFNKMNTQSGGNDTEDLLYRIDNKLNNMRGGATKTATKKSTTKTATKKSTTKTATKKSATKTATKKSATKTATTDNKLTVSDIHKEVIVMIQDLGYSEEEAKIIKAGLYNYTKNEHPELNSYNRAMKMKEYTTKNHIANIDIMAVRQAIEIHYKNKNKN